MTLQIPTLLALLGTALMAVVIFAPKRELPAAAAISCAPPTAPPPVERWAPPAVDVDLFAAAFPELPEPVAAATWPTLIDPRAEGCTRETRLGLVDALASVGSAWAETMLHHARDDEPDETVRAAIDVALQRIARTSVPVSSASVSSSDDSAAFASTVNRAIA